MCGINGIFAYKDDAPPVERAELLRVREAMARRGPDGAGLWISPDQRVGLAHRRLTIIDLSEAGAQPMATADGRLRITFNGEIYNYKALRKELEGKGRLFRSQSDTEVLLHLYAERGAEMVHALRGMYAFGIWDEQEKTLFLARDAFGIKPLYYTDDGGSLRFASQVKALLKGGAASPAPDSAGRVGFLLWGCVPEPFTLYRGIHALPAGTCLTLRRGGARHELVHFSVRRELLRAQDEARGFRNDDRTALAEMLRDSARQHLVADVPVGIFLSSGVDSTLVASLASEQSGAKLRSFTLGFEEYRDTRDDEVPLAQKSARALGTQHETRRIRRQDFETELAPILEVMDQPSTDGVNTYFVCREAARAGLKVALSGLGGDELFGGYPSFRDVPRIARWLRPASFAPGLGRLARRIAHPALSHFTSPKYAGLMEYGGSFEGAYLLRRALFMPWEVGELLDAADAQDGLERLQTVPQLADSIHGLKRDHARVSALELAWYMRNQLLRDADWAGMAHSLEIRVPFVDVALFRALAPWLVSERPPSKKDAAAAADRSLMREIVHRRKSGFSVPVQSWLARNEADAVHAASSQGRGLRGWSRIVFSGFQFLPADAGIPVRRTASAKDATTRERILVYRIGQVGDTVASLPSFWAIRRRFPDAHITLLCDRQPDTRFVLAADLLRGTDLVDEFQIYRANESGPGRLRWSAHMLNVLLRLRHGRFDKLIYLAPSTRTAPQVARDRRYFRSAGIKRLVGLGADAPPISLIAGHPAAAALHEADLLLARLAVDGIPVAKAGHGCMDLQLGDNEEREVQRWLATLPSDGGRRWIAIGPGSKMQAKRWPAQRYAEVVGALIAEHDVWPVVLGGAEDAVLAQALVAAWRRGYNAAGALDLRAAAAAMRRCAFYLGNDTGTMHLAAAAGTPCIAVFSARDVPGRWHPYGEGHTVFRTTIDCEGCGLVECLARKNECLTRISAQEVLDACRVQLNRARENAVNYVGECG